MTPTDNLLFLSLSLSVFLFPHQHRPTFCPSFHPRSLAAARGKAVELVGQAKFDAALADPWIDRYMQTSVQIYGETIQNGNNAVPKLVFGSRWVIPQPNDTDDFVLILQDSLTVPRP